MSAFLHFLHVAVDAALLWVLYREHLKRLRLEEELREERRLLLAARHREEKLTDALHEASWDVEVGPCQVEAYKALMEKVREKRRKAATS